MNDVVVDAHVETGAGDGFGAGYIRAGTLGRVGS